MKCGGTSVARPATDEIKQMVKDIRDKVEKKAGESFTDFEAYSYTSQVVAGTNYFVKIKVSEADYIHVRIFKPLPFNSVELEVVAVQKNKGVDEEIEYF